MTIFAKSFLRQLILLFGLALAFYSTEPQLIQFYTAAPWTMGALGLLFLAGWLYLSLCLARLRAEEKWLIALAEGQKYEQAPVLLKNLGYFCDQTSTGAYTFRRPSERYLTTALHSLYKTLFGFTSTTKMVLNLLIIIGVLGSLVSLMMSLSVTADLLKATSAEDMSALFLSDFRTVLTSLVALFSPALAGIFLAIIYALFDLNVIRAYENLYQKVEDFIFSSPKQLQSSAPLKTADFKNFAELEQRLSDYFTALHQKLEQISAGDGQQALLQNLHETLENLTQKLDSGLAPKGPSKLEEMTIEHLQAISTHLSELTEELSKQESADDQIEAIKAQLQEIQRSLKMPLAAVGEN